MPRHTGRALRGRVDRNKMTLFAYFNAGNVKVAPFAGAWIETKSSTVVPANELGHSRALRGRVDRNVISFHCSRCRLTSRLRGRVDRNMTMAEREKATGGRALRGRVDRNTKKALPSRRTRHRKVAPFAGAWIETMRTRRGPTRGTPSRPSRRRRSKHNLVEPHDAAAIAPLVALRATGPCLSSDGSPVA